jgi:hypothetical protein
MSWVDWLLDAKHRELLTWLGSGVVIVMSGFWRFYTWKYPKPKEDKPAAPAVPPQSIHADKGSVAVNVAGEHNQIHIGK